MTLNPPVASSAGRSHLFLTFLGLTLAFLLMLFWRGFADPDEGRYAEIPREMVESGNWLEMRMFGYRYYEKPPVAYWLVAPAIRIFGARDWAVRIPLLLSIACLAWLFAKRLGKAWPRATAKASFLCAFTAIGFVIGACLLLTDVFLSVFFSATLLWLYDAFQPDVSRNRKLLLVMAAAAAAAVGFLTKGALALVLPAGILMLWLAWERRMLALLSPAMFAGIGLTLLLLVPAMAIIEQHNPDFLRKFIFEEHLARFHGTRGYQGHEEPFYFFGPVILLLMLPWAGFVFRAIRRAWKERKQPLDSFARLLVVWSVVVVVFFSISVGKLMSYIMPAIFPIGLLLGRWGVAVPPEQNDQWDKRLWQIGVGVMLLLSIGLTGFWAVAFFQLAPKEIYPITGISVLALVPTLGCACLAWKSGGFRSFNSLLIQAVGILLTSALLLSPLAGKDFNVRVHLNSSHVYKNLGSVLKPNDCIVLFWRYRPALPFYTERIPLLFQVRNELEYGMNLEHPNRREINDLAELAQRTKAVTGRIYAVVEPKKLQTRFLPLGLPHALTDLPSDPDTVVFEIFPNQWQTPEQPNLRQATEQLSDKNIN